MRKPNQIKLHPIGLHSPIPFMCECKAVLFPVVGDMTCTCGIVYRIMRSSHQEKLVITKKCDCAQKPATESSKSARKVISARGGII